MINLPDNVLLLSQVVHFGVEFTDQSVLQAPEIRYISAPVQGKKNLV
jgi:hypothetical protein